MITSKRRLLFKSAAVLFCLTVVLTLSADLVNGKSLGGLSHSRSAVKKALGNGKPGARVRAADDNRVKDTEDAVTKGPEAMVAEAVKESLEVDKEIKIEKVEEKKKEQADKEKAAASGESSGEGGAAGGPDGAGGSSDGSKDSHDLSGSADQLSVNDSDTSWNDSPGAAKPSMISVYLGFTGIITFWLAILGGIYFLTFKPWCWYIKGDKDDGPGTTTQPPGGSSGPKSQGPKDQSSAPSRRASA